MNKQELKALLEKFEADKCTAEEIGMLESWYLQWKTEETIDIDQAEAEQRVDHIWDRLESVEIKKGRFKLWPRLIAAAVVLIALSSVLYFYFNQPVAAPQDPIVQDVPAGGNKAYLTLADGKRITLTDAANGELAHQTGVKITKSKDGQLIYSVSKGDGVEKADKAYNKVETPKGGQYQVYLPDGTKVWLNAASSLRFPSAFKGLKERLVELDGEAYFEVAHNRKQPFIVKTAKQEITVLGTHFNISSYTDEEMVKTTLLQGAVLINRLKNTPSEGVEGKDFVVLKPGQQCILGKAFHVSEADVEMAVSWKDGNFMFNNLDLQSIMKQLSRWYIVDVDYSNMPNNRVFTGFIARSENLSKVLGMLYEVGGIKFKLENKTIKIAN